MTLIYSHRGYNNKIFSDNSIQSLDLAYKKGYRAIEFDVWLIKNELILSHDKPNIKSLINLARFSDYFKYKNEFQYWIDFKNINKDNAHRIMNEIKRVIKKNRVSSKNILFAPYITNLSKAVEIYQIIHNYFPRANIAAVCDHIDKGNLLKYYNALKENKIKSLSINHKIIDKEFMNIYSQINIFAWTVNNKNILNRLRKLGIKNFASDNILPINQD